MLGVKHLRQHGDEDSSYQDGDSLLMGDCNAVFPSFADDFRTRLWFTYRKNFPLIEGSLYTSDMGWGCMHRTAQMVLGQAFLVHYLGRGQLPSFTHFKG